MARGPKTNLIFERISATSDGMGGYTNLWASLKVISGVFQQLSSNEVEKWSNVVGVVTHKFVFDTLIDITPTMADRLRLDQKIFEIKSLEIIDQHGNITSLILSEIV